MDDDSKLTDDLDVTEEELTSSGMHLTDADGDDDLDPATLPKDDEDEEEEEDDDDDEDDEEV